MYIYKVHPAHCCFNSFFLYLNSVLNTEISLKTELNYGDDVAKAFLGLEKSLKIKDHINFDLLAGVGSQDKYHLTMLF